MKTENLSDCNELYAMKENKNILNRVIKGYIRIFDKEKKLWGKEEHITLGNKIVYSLKKGDVYRVKTNLNDRYVFSEKITDINKDSEDWIFNYDNLVHDNENQLGIDSHYDHRKAGKRFNDGWVGE